MPVLGSGFRVVPLQRTSQFRYNDKHEDGPIKPNNLRIVQGFPFTNVISKKAKRPRIDYLAVSVLWSNEIPEQAQMAQDDKETREWLATKK
jgi:hypothetical protein